MQILNLDISLSYDKYADRWNLFAQCWQGTLKLIISHNATFDPDEYKVELWTDGDSVELMSAEQYREYVELAQSYGHDLSDVCERVHEIEPYHLQKHVDAMIERWRMLNTLASFQVNFM